jgi:hypothetical protein
MADTGISGACEGEPTKGHHVGGVHSVSITEWRIMNTRTETKFNFTVTGPGRSFGVWHDDADVTESYWGDEVPEPLTQAEIIGLVGCFSENSPIVWGDPRYGTWGTFTSPVDPDDDEVGTYSINLEPAE